MSLSILEKMDVQAKIFELYAVLETAELMEKLTIQSQLMEQYDRLGLGGDPLPEVPSTEPEVPSAEPEVPSIEPEVPSIEPEVPSTEPEVPSTEPEVPSAEPEVPSAEPEVPSIEPEVPSTEPEVPSTEPPVNVPVEEPSADSAMPLYQRFLAGDFNREPSSVFIRILQELEPFVGDVLTLKQVIEQSNEWWSITGVKEQEEMDRLNEVA